MKINTLVKQGVLIVRIEGELDMHVADEFRNVVDTALEKNQVRNILLSLKGVSFIDSSGLGVILGRYKKVSVLGGTMLASHVQPNVAKIFELSGLLKIIRQFNTETEAMTYL